MLLITHKNDETHTPQEPGLCAKHGLFSVGHGLFSSITRVLSSVCVCLLYLLYTCPMAVKDEKYAAAMAYFADLAEKQKNSPETRERDRKYEAYLEAQRVAFEDACSQNPDLYLLLVRLPLPSHFSRYPGDSMRIEVEALTPAGYGQAAEELVKELQIGARPKHHFYVDEFAEIDDWYDNRSDSTRHFVRIIVGTLENINTALNAN